MFDHLERMSLKAHLRVEEASSFISSCDSSSVDDEYDDAVGEVKRHSNRLKRKKEVGHALLKSNKTLKT